jgi:nicotinamide riboside kinase
MKNTLSTREIYIIGPSSTGKTTLCNALARHLDLNSNAFITEVARDVMRSTGFTRADVGSLAMQQAILNAQVKREEEARTCNEVVLSDRSGVDPVVYALLTAKSEADALEKRRALASTPAFQGAVSAYRKALVVLLTPVPQWVVDDGVRSLDDQLSCLHVFRQLLAELKIIYTELGPERMDLKERVDFVVKKMELRWTRAEKTRL